MSWLERRAVSSGRGNSAERICSQTLVFGWLSHPDASLETLASMAATRQVQVTDTAIHKRFTQASCAHFLHAVLEEMTSVVVEASQEVPLELLRRFEAVMLEDSSSIALPNELAEQWQGCGGAPGEGQAAVKLHVRWELKQGQLHGPRLTGGRISDRSSPFKEDPLPPGSLYIADLGYLDWGNIAARRAAGSYTLTRAQARTLYWTTEGRPLKLDPLLPQQVGQTKELWVRVGEEHRHLMRLLILRVPQDVAKLRRADLEADAKRRGQQVAGESLETSRLDSHANRCPCKPAELAGGAGEAAGAVANGNARTTLWKQYGRIDEWHTAHSWRVLCELYAKLIGLLLQHWLILLFAQAGTSSEVWSNLPRWFVIPPSSLLEALAGGRSLRSALQVIQRRMRSGCQLNKRKKHPNAAQLLQRGSTNWALSP